MPRTLEPVLSMALERANPNVCHFVEVNAPDVSRVLRRGADQFLVPVSQSPANSIAADPAGALTIKSTESTLADFTAHADVGDVNLYNANPSPNDFRGFRWTIDKSFGRAVIRKFRAVIRRKPGSGASIDLGLQIHRISGQGVIGTPAGPQNPGLIITFPALLDQPAIWKNDESKWTANVAIVEFDISAKHLEVGTSNVPVTGITLGNPSGTTGEEPALYFVIAPLNAPTDNLFFWYRDHTSSHTIAGVGKFDDAWWRRVNSNDPTGWSEEVAGGAFLPVAIPTAAVTIESYLATAQAIYALTLPAAPQAASVGRVVFERGVPAGTDATLELSTAGSGGPWTPVAHGDIVTTHQATYHARVTLTSNSAHRAAPRVAAIGIEFVTPVDVTAEAIVETISQEIDVPFLKSSIGEGSVTVVRAGRRDYRDLASDLASLNPSSKLEVDVMLGSRHPLVTRDKWLLVDRALVNNRAPSPTSEQFGLLSYLKMLKRKIPQRAEAINETRIVSSATTTSITVSSDLPDIDDGDYSGKGYYVRIQKSAQPGFEAGGYVQTIDSSTGTRTINFNALSPLPGTLTAADIVEIHSGSFVQQGLTWTDADTADIWWEILTVHLLIPEERIGRGDLGRAGLSGLPPKVADRAPGDVETQKKLKVTLATKQAESADELIDQLSFLMGGATVDIGGQIVFRQIYPLRDVNGQIVVPAEPIAATFDVRNTTALSTPTAVEQRIAQLACDYGVNTTAVSDDTPPTETTNFVDVDAIAWLDDQPFDELAAAAIPAEIARWCYNSADAGLYLASVLTQQVVRAASTGLRVWTWTATERQPHLVVGDRVAVITDSYTDYDPARKIPIRGWWAYTLAIVAVQGGGTRFRGYMLGLTDAVQLRGGPGTLAAADDTTDKTEILSVTFEDSADGKTRTYDIVAGPAVETVHVHHRLWPIGTSGNPFDFLADEDIADGPQLIIVHPDSGDGHFRFTLPHPSREFQRYILLVPRQGLPSLAAGEGVWKFILDPAPSGVYAKFKPVVHNDTADLTILLGAAVSDWPVRYEIVEGSPDNAPLLTVTLSSPATIDPTTNPVLGARPLPLLALQNWWVHWTNVADEEDWLGPSSADRDPLANGVVTVDTYRSAPVFRMVFDTNTDAIKVTIPDGRTKTWSRAQLDVAGSPVLYTVGNVLDDASTETAFAVDESRQPYKVEYQGGGIWTTMFGPAGVLHGQASNPPTARTRAVKNALGSTEDLYVLPDSSVPEKLRVYYRDGELDTSPVYGLVVSAGDSTPLYVTAGTEIGPSNFFVTGVSSPVAKLSGIALTSDQIKRVAVQVEGQDSLLRNSWIPVALSLLDKPFNQSLELVWDNALGKLRAIVVAGARCLFETIQFANNSAFTSPTTVTDVITEGGTLIKELALSGAQRGVTWYARAIPNSHTADDGLDGDPLTASVAVPSLFDVQPSVAETVTTGTLTLVVSDPGGVLDPTWTNGVITTAISFQVARLGVTTIEAPTTHPGSGTTGTYTKAVTLLDHPIQILAFAHLVDGSVEPLGTWVFDSNKVSDLINAAVANNGVTATVTAVWDTDALVGANNAEYSLNGGSSWTAVTISAARVSAFNITRISSKQTVLLHAKNVIDGVFGNQSQVEIDAYISDGPSLDLREVVSDKDVVITYVATGTITVSINGASYTTPSASPFTVNRSTSADQTYEFRVLQAGQTISRLVTIPAISQLGQGTVSVDANGVWNVTGDGPGNALSFKYLSSTSAFPADATVASSGTITSGHTFSVISGGTLTFGQTIFITVIPYTQNAANGVALSSIHLRGSYTTYSGSKTQNYSASQWAERISNNGINWDSNHNALFPSIAGPGYAMTLDLFSIVPAGVTITAFAVNAFANSSGPGCPITIYRRTGTSLTSIGTGSPSVGAGFVVVTISLSELVSAGRSYLTSVSWVGVGTPPAAGSAGVGDVAVTYTMPDPKQTL